MYRKYKIEIEEVLSLIIETEAENEETALQKIKELYLSENIVLSSENYVETNIRLIEDERAIN